MGMQAKYGALEIKSKELLAQQGTAVSGASVALNSLGSRLEQLVEQLIASYNISEQELEVIEGGGGMSGGYNGGHDNIHSVFGIMTPSIEGALVKLSIVMSTQVLCNISL